MDKGLNNNLAEAARRAAVDNPDTPLEFLTERPYDPIKEQKFIEGAMWMLDYLVKSKED